MKVELIRNLLLIGEQYQKAIREITEDFIKEDFTPNQIQCIIDGCKKGLTEEQISCFAKPEIDIAKMNMIKYALETFKLPTDIVSKYAKPKYSLDLLNNIYRDYYDGLLSEEIDEYVQAYESGADYQLKRFKILREKYY